MLRSHAAKIAVAVLLALFLYPVLSAQTSRPQPRPTAHPKLTPQQQVGLSILDQQAGAAKALSPVMRTFALLEIARGYQKFNRPKAVATLRDALQASLAIDDGDGSQDQTKSPLQSQIISLLAAMDPAYCEQLVPQLAGPPRATAVGALVNRYTFEKQFPRAIAVLRQLGDQEFPYIIVSRLMQALPPEMAADKQNLFSQALASFSQHEHKDKFGPNDFAVFITRTWPGLPPDLVLQAIDEGLKQARDSDTKMEITVDAQKGAASFTSTYQYTLFELMPVLRALDPERAESLLQDNRDLQSAAKSYPNGLQSLDPKNGIPDSITMRLPGSKGSSAGDRYDEELRRHTQQILTLANRNPKQALAAVMSLPDFDYARALALLDFAGAVLKTSPDYAADALDEFIKIVPSVEQETSQADLLATAGDDYLKLSDTDSARKVVDQGFKLAEKLYATDTDAGDPNQAFKAMWPSTSAWRRFVALATRISPQAALQAINRIPDPEIQSLETIALANSLLGAPSATQMVAVKTKSKNSYMVGVQP